MYQLRLIYFRIEFILKWIKDSNFENDNESVKEKRNGTINSSCKSLISSTPMSSQNENSMHLLKV